MKRTVLILIVLLVVGGCHPKPKTSAPAAKITQSPQVKSNTGLPFPLLLPPSARAEQDLDLLQPTFDAGMTTWRTTFGFEDGFDVLVADFERQLKGQGFNRLTGPDRSADVKFKGTDRIKPPSAYGKREWISKDRTIALLLDYQYKRAVKDQPELNAYQLTVVKTDKPTEIKPPSKVEPIK